MPTTDLLNRRRMIQAMISTSAAVVIPVAAGILPGAAQAQSVDATAINRWLMNLRDAEGRFEQTNPRGDVQTGSFLLSRPGRIRFDYDRPEGAAVIADGRMIGVFDPRSNRNPTRYPLDRSPLALLLDTSTSLADPGLVRGATRDAAGVHITVQDPVRPEAGRMVMTFSESPVRLLSWTMIQPNGGRTVVRLTRFTEVASVNRSRFNIELEAANRGLL